MNHTNIGFIGAGKMAEAMLGGMLAAGVAREGQVWVSDKDDTRLSRFRSRFPKIKTTAENLQVVRGCVAVFLCIKPQDMQGVLREIRDAATREHLFISIAAGVQIAALEKELPKARVVRVMPNIAAGTGEAMSAFSIGARAKHEDREFIKRALYAFGRGIEVDEKMMHAVTALSGSGPAFVALVVDALAKAGIEKGLPEETAYLLANQTALGTARLMMDKGMKPHELIGLVKSPKGTTEAGMKVLEERNVCRAFADAVSAAEKRSRELGK